jgi:hypothetical protein
MNMLATFKKHSYFLKCQIPKLYEFKKVSKLLQIFKVSKLLYHILMSYNVDDVLRKIIAWSIIKQKNVMI